ncbi:MAG TPA: SPFH domain-containing protein [Streptosporangiaceae bacterium]|nr:SPFH domain-containing protein [Streptosporangiaceae bacterium]
MALLGREFIAVPDDRKGQIVFKWPDVSIRRYTRAIVNADEMAMFVNTGQVVQTLGPGRHQIDANELPGLGILIDAATGGNAYRAELYFVGTREYTGFKFGGRVDDVQDPRTGLVVTLRVFGDYALRVADPVRLVTNLTSTVDVTDNERIAGWVSDQLLKVLRTHVTTQIIRNGWPILGLMAYSAEIEQNTIDAGNGQLAAYGVQLTRMGNFDINLSPEDEQQLKQLAKDTSYSQLAGGFQNYAAGEMALGAGQGLAKGGAGTEGAFLGAGFGLASAFGAQQAQAMQAQQAEAAQRAAQQHGVPYGQGGPAQGAPPQGAPLQGGPPQAPPAQPAPQAPPTQQAAAVSVCASCEAANPAGARFCMSCGQGLAPAVTHCTECGTELPGGARFCANCGTRVGG